MEGEVPINGIESGSLTEKIKSRKNIIIYMELLLIILQKKQEKPHTLWKSEML